MVRDTLNFSREIFGYRRRELPSLVNLLASASRTSSASGADVTSDLIKEASALLLIVNVTAQSGTTPTLDLAIQAKIGTNYVNLARFSQYGAATGLKGINVKRDLAFSTELVPASDPAVGSGLLVNNHDLLDTLRAKWLLGGTTPNYTFSVDIYPIN